MAALENVSVPTTAKTTFTASASVVYNSVTYDVDDDADEEASVDVGGLDTDVDIDASPVLVIDAGGGASGAGSDYHQGD